MARTLDLERRGALVHQALEVLRARGGRLTMTELARALGIKRPTLYFYFRDLTGLLHAAVDDVYRHHVGHLIGRIAAVEHPVLALGELARATVELQRGRRDLVLLLIQLWAAGGSDPEQLIARGRAATAPLRAELVARLAAGVERGVVAPCDPARVVDLVLAVIDGVLMQEIMRGAGGAPVVEELWQRVLAPLVVPAGAAAPRPVLGPAVPGAAGPALARAAPRAAGPALARAAPRASAPLPVPAVPAPLSVPAPRRAARPRRAHP